MTKLAWNVPIVICRQCRLGFFYPYQAIHWNWQSCPEFKRPEPARQLMEDWGHCPLKRETCSRWSMAPGRNIPRCSKSVDLPKIYFYHEIVHEHCNWLNHRQRKKEKCLSLLIEKNHGDSEAFVQLILLLLSSKSSHHFVWNGVVWFAEGSEGKMARTHTFVSKRFIRISTGTPNHLVF